MGPAQVRRRRRPRGRSKDLRHLLPLRQGNTHTHTHTHTHRHKPSPSLKPTASHYILTQCCSLHALSTTVTYNTPYQRYLPHPHPSSNSLLTHLSLLACLPVSLDRVPVSAGGRPCDRAGPGAHQGGGGQRGPARQHRQTPRTQGTPHSHTHPLSHILSHTSSLTHPLSHTLSHTHNYYQ